MSATSVVAGTGPTTMNEAIAVYDRIMAQARGDQTLRDRDKENRLDPIDLTSDLKYLFRFKVGTGNKRLFHIDYKEPDWGLDDHTKEGRAKKELLRLWERRNPDPAWREVLEQAVLDNGSTEITFSAVDQTREAWYATNSDAIAKVIRKAIAAGHDPNLYEQRVDREILANGQRFADTVTGRKAAMDFIAETGGELKYVVKGTNKPYPKDTE